MQVRAFKVQKQWILSCFWWKEGPPKCCTTENMANRV